MTSPLVERVARAMAERCRRSHDWPFWLDEARAAIEAMREPTEAMIEAGSDVDDGEGFYLLGERVTTTCWQAMLDAALKEG